MHEPIWNEEAEKTVLGCVFLNQRTINKLKSVLSPNDFYGSLNRSVYSAMLELSKNGDDIDIRSVFERIKEDDMHPTRKTQTIVEIGSYTDYAATAANVDYHAKTVKTYAVRRDLEKKSKELGALSRDMSISIDDVMSITSQSILDVSNSYHSSNEKPILLVDVISNVIDDVAQNKPARMIKLGFSGIEIPVGLVSCFAGRPANGKSILGLNGATNAAINGHHVLYYTIEDSAENMARRILARKADLSTRDIERANVPYDAMQRLSKTIQSFAGKKFYFIGDERDSIDVNWIRDYAYNHQSTHGQIDLIVVDYLQLLDFDAKISEVGALNYAMRTLKSLAKRLNCAVLIMSQVVKDNSGTQCPEPPTIQQLKGSGMIFEISKYILTVHYRYGYTQSQDDANTVRLACVKNSNGPTDAWFAHCNYARMTVGDRVDDVPAPNTGWESSNRFGDDDY